MLVRSEGQLLMLAGANWQKSSFGDCIIDSVDGKPVSVMGLQMTS